MKKKTKAKSKIRWDIRRVDYDAPMEQLLSNGCEPFAVSTERRYVGLDQMGNTTFVYLRKKVKP
jgi:hypothetical protein